MSDETKNLGRRLFKGTPVPADPSVNGPQAP